MRQQNEVSRVIVSRRGGDLAAALHAAIAGLGAVVLNDLSGCRVLIKANFNSPHRYPASSDPAFLTALIAVVRAAGAAGIRLGDSCGLRWAPAEKVASRLGIQRLADRLGVEWVNLDAGPWRDVSVPGTRFTTVRIAEPVFEADRLVYACCLKTHPAAAFSASLKHTVGLLPPTQRWEMHQDEMARRIAEINLAVRPHLIVLDARKCFVAGGPAIGWVRRPDLILASRSRIALDTEAVRILGRFLALNRLRRNPQDEPQLRHAAALGIDAHLAAPSVDDGGTR